MTKTLYKATADSTPSNEKSGNAGDKGRGKEKEVPDFFTGFVYSTLFLNVCLYVESRNKP